MHLGRDRVLDKLHGVLVLVELRQCPLEGCKLGSNVLHGIGDTFAGHDVDDSRSSRHR